MVAAIDVEDGILSDRAPTGNSNDLDVIAIGDRAIFSATLGKARLIRRIQSSPQSWIVLAQDGPWMGAAASG